MKFIQNRKDTTDLEKISYLVDQLSTDYIINCQTDNATLEDLSTFRQNRARKGIPLNCLQKCGKP